MIVDTSALVAILRNEPEMKQYLEKILSAPVVRLSAAGYLESAVIIDSSRNPASSRRFDEFVLEAEIVVEPFTANQARIAREAYRDFGKGSGHAAGLNFGDCMAYALAKDKQEPLLFKGSDLSKTDVQIAG